MLSTNAKLNFLLVKFLKTNTGTCWQGSAIKLQQSQPRATLTLKIPGQVPVVKLQRCREGIFLPCCVNCSSMACKKMHKRLNLVLNLDKENNLKR